MLKIRGKRNVLLFVIYFLAIGVPVPLCSAVEAQGVAITPGYAEQAAQGAATLQQWYEQSTGLYAAPSGWWNSANAITVLVNYCRVTGNKEYLAAIANTFVKANTANHTVNFINTYDDDEGWWALAWIDAYDLTGNRAYLTMAESIFADIATEWDTTTCGGGVWWSKSGGGTYKNAIANELFLAVAASLANRVGDPARKALYLGWAQKEWRWFKNSGMMNAQNLINDGLNSTNPKACTNNGKTAWSYNQGVILGGLVELYRANHDPTLLPTAEAIANAAITNLTLNGILKERTVSGSDTPQFKGIFVRNLALLYKAAPKAEYKRFVDANANSIWTDDQGPDYEFGGVWQGPFDSGDATRQTSALDVLVAAAEMQ
ncbi:MAG: glycoside hydrolase family 76 protein [Terracidiphilus sp.]